MPRPLALIDLLPPVVLRWRRQFLGRERGYSDYAAALQSCGEGYDSNLLASVVAQKTLAVKLRGPSHLFGVDYRVFAALEFGRDSVAGGGLRVLDFGGGAGAHYLSARSIIPRHITLNWCVVETPAMVNAASPLSCEELSFHKTISAAVDSLKDVPDLVFNRVCCSMYQVRLTLSEILLVLEPNASSLLGRVWRLTGSGDTQFSTLRLRPTAQGRFLKVREIGRSGIP